jgi:hypothetical protein
MSAPWLDDIYKPLGFSQINGAPHDIPEKAIDSISTFQRNNVVSAFNHLAKFKSVTFRASGARHLDVTMKLFALSLEDDAVECWKGLPNNSFNAWAPLENAFLEKWGERRDNKYLLDALSSAKRNENETIEEFNKKFNQIMQRLHTDIKPPGASILIYYLHSFDGELGF